MSREKILIGFVGALAIIIFGVAIARLAAAWKTTEPSVALKNLTAPTVNLTDPQRGPIDAPVTVVIFSDFGCDSCAVVDEYIKTLEKESGLRNKIKFVWKDFPAHENIYPETITLHKAAHCAQVQGKFWEFSAAAFEQIDKIKEGAAAVLPDILQKVSLNSATLQTCIDSPATEDIVKNNFAEGKQLKITGTPTFFFGKSRIDGLQPYSVLAGMLRNEVARAAAPR